MAQRFCEQCGFELSPGAKFCGGCGMALAQDPGQGTPKPSAAPKPPAAPKPEPDRRPVKWRSTDDEVDLSDYPYAESSASSFLTGALMLGAMMSSGGNGDGLVAPLVTTWPAGRDEGAVRRSEHLSDVAEVFGSFVESLGLLDGPWDALEVNTPLGHRGLVMVTEGEWPEAGREQGIRLLVPLAYGVDPTDRDRAQLRATVDWMLSKMASPYMNYVPLINDASERDGLMKAIVEASGTPVEGPLSDADWLADPDVSAIGSNPQGFPGAGALRIGILDECEESRQRAVFRDGSLTLVDLSGGTVDVYAGWQVEAKSFGFVGLMALGHRSLMALIDAVEECDDLSRELGGVRVNG
jgi:hypothetical protein